MQAVTRNTQTATAAHPSMGPRWTAPATMITMSRAMVDAAGCAQARYTDVYVGEVA